jgi:serine/threonine protein kinase
MEPSPKLADPWNWSEEFGDFISICLHKDKEKRPSAEELLTVRCTCHARLRLRLRLRELTNHVAS